LIKKLKSLINTEEKKRLVSNFFSLSVLQVFSYVLPLLTLPYLVRVLGVEKFGLVMFAQAFIMFFNIFVDFGFNLSAVREISIHRDDKEKLTEIFSSVMIIKFILILISLIILTVIVFSFDKFKNDKILYYLTFLVVIGQAMFPVWYFQGIEKMKYITIVNITSKLLFTIAIFIFIHKQNDYILVPVFNGLGFLVGGGLSLWIVFKYFNQKFLFQKIKTLWFYFKESSHFFLSRVANEGLNSYIIMIIGILYSNTIVGYYSMIEKLYKAYYVLVQPLIQTIYPNMAKNKNLIFFKKIYLLTSLTFMFLTILLIFFSPFILNVIYGFSNEIVVKLFFILFFATFFGITNALIGYPLLAAFGYTKEANYSLVIGAVISFVYVTICYFNNANIYILVLSIVLYEIVSVSIRIYNIYTKIYLKRKQ
jgi:PST family polysaccharide transporter